MVSMRPYRAPFSFAEAVSKMEAEIYLGQWDPNFAGKFIEMIKAKQRRNPW
jgi:HD-GYP domain-containing protein (c-di-GMP phosphodiesterase class II)